MIVCRPVRDADLIDVAERIRPMDRRECLEIYEVEPLQGLRDSVAASPWCAAVVSDGELIAIAGVAADGDLLSMRGIPWMIGVDGIEKHPRAFVVLTNHIIARMEQEYPLLENVVLEENTLSIGWLTRAGFTMGKPELIGGARCLRFWKARDGLVCSSSSGERSSQRVRLCEGRERREQGGQVQPSDV